MSVCLSVCLSLPLSFTVIKFIAIEACVKYGNELLDRLLIFACDLDLTNKHCF